MSAVDTAPPRPQAHDDALTRERVRTYAWPAAVGLVLLTSFLLRIWGVRQGLPYAYNADENAHFVPKAIGLFGHGWNPDYFVNPPAYTYVLHIVFLVWFGGREAVSHTYATDPSQVFVIARVTSAVLGTIAVWLLYLTGTRLLDRRVGLLAAGLLGVAFLPVFYSHLGLNDVPTLAPVCLGLYGAAGILRKGRPIDYVTAGVGLGLAAATKYTGGIVLVPILGAVAARRDWRGLAVAGGLAVAAFLLANPYAIIHPSDFWGGITHQSTATDEVGGKLGLTQHSGIVYYLWTFTWGLGWIPAVAALFGAALLIREDRRLGIVLVPAPLLFLLFMGTQQRYFGRWLLPIFPLVCLLGAYLALSLADRAGARRPALRPTFVAIAVVALCVQGVLFSVHAGLVLSRPDTRNLTRAWLVANVPPTTKIVVAPVVPDAWAQDIGQPSALTSNGNRWIKFPTSRTRYDEEGRPLKGKGRIVNIEDYERTTRPELVDAYERAGYCWVVDGSTQSGRAFADPSAVPNAIAYYRRLRARGTIAFRSSPYRSAGDDVGFNFDWSFDFYPLQYERPGPVMTVYKLDGGACKS